MVNKEPPRRRRLSVDDRRQELLDACLDLIGARPWDEVSMADVAIAAGVSKPLVYHYFSTKRDLYVATVAAAAEELRAATRPDPTLPLGPRLRVAIDAHLAWVDRHGDAYRAIVAGGSSADPDIAAIVEASRAQVVDGLAEGLGVAPPAPAQRIALRGWVGFLEGACLDWLARRDLSRADLADLLAASATNVLRSAGIDARPARGRHATDQPQERPEQ